MTASVRSLIVGAAMCVVSSTVTEVAQAQEGAPAAVSEDYAAELAEYNRRMEEVENRRDASSQDTDWGGVIIAFALVTFLILVFMRTRSTTNKSIAYMDHGMEMYEKCLKQNEQIIEQNETVIGLLTSIDERLASNKSD